MMNPFGVMLKKSISRRKPSDPKKINKQASIKLQQNVRKLTSVLAMLKTKGSTKRLVGSEIVKVPE